MKAYKAGRVAEARALYSIGSTLCCLAICLGWVFIILGIVLTILFAVVAPPDDRDEDS